MKCECCGLEKELKAISRKSPDDLLIELFICRDCLDLSDVELFERIQKRGDSEISRKWKCNPRMLLKGKREYDKTLE